MKTITKKLAVTKRRNFQQPGKWVDRPRKSIILLCLCGNKYIKTRDKQIVCIRCINHGVPPTI
ncbi:MAG: hypothetical protein V4467_04370 [Patescibacteria group bacterium]